MDTLAESHDYETRSKGPPVIKDISKNIRVKRKQQFVVENTPPKQTVIIEASSVSSNLNKKHKSKSNSKEPVTKKT